MKKKLFLILLSLVLTLGLLAVPASAAKSNVYTSTLDIASIRQNASGNGYVWKNIDGTLELNNITIDTTDSVGLTVPENATITLKGKNYIKASDTAITCLTSATFQGSGTLTVVSNGIGIRSLSLNSDDSIRFRSDKMSITAEKIGVYSEKATLVFSSKSAEIAAGEYAVKGERVKIVSGTLSTDGGILSAEVLTVNAANLSVNSSGEALHSDRKTDISNVSLSVGSSSDSLSPAEKYNGESCIKTVSTVKAAKRGVLFGGRFHVFFDYLTFILIAAAIAAVVILPIYIKYRKTKRISEQAQEKKTKR